MDPGPSNQSQDKGKGPQTRESTQVPQISPCTQISQIPPPLRAPPPALQIRATAPTAVPPREPATENPNRQSRSTLTADLVSVQTDTFSLKSEVSVLRELVEGIIGNNTLEERSKEEIRKFMDDTSCTLRSFYDRFGHMDYLIGKMDSRLAEQEIRSGAMLRNFEQINKDVQDIHQNMRIWKSVLHVGYNFQYYTVVNASQVHILQYLLDKSYYGKTSDLPIERLEIINGTRPLVIGTPNEQASALAKALPSLAIFLEACTNLHAIIINNIHRLNGEDQHVLEHRLRCAQETNRWLATMASAHNWTSLFEYYILAGMFQHLTAPRVKVDAFVHVWKRMPPAALVKSTFSSAKLEA